MATGKTKRATRKATSKNATTRKKAAVKPRAKGKSAPKWYEQSMEARAAAFSEEFGETSPPGSIITPTDASLYMSSPGLGFLRFPRAPGRPFWLYVTHGLSQPQRAAHAKRNQHLGFELAFATSRALKWPVVLLERLVSYVLSSGRPILPHDRLPSSDLMDAGPGGALLALKEPGITTVFETPKGTFNLQVLVGVTAGEYAIARTLQGKQGSAALEVALHSVGVGCVTNRKRACLTGTTAFDKAWAGATDNL